jgi:vacuolar-type H+-ATPase subunit E/Vma4
MTAIQVLREEVKQYIDNADDKSLRKVKTMLSKELKEENWDDLPKELQVLLDAAIKEGEEGNVISHEKIVEKYSKWFRK